MRSLNESLSWRITYTARPFKNSTLKERVFARTHNLTRRMWFGMLLMIVISYVLFVTGIRGELANLCLSALIALPLYAMVEIKREHYIKNDLMAFVHRDVYRQWHRFLRSYGLKVSRRKSRQMLNNNDFLLGEILNINRHTSLSGLVCDVSSGSKLYNALYRAATATWRETQKHN